MKKIQELNIQTWPQKERRNASYFKEDFAIFEVSKASISDKVEDIRFLSMPKRKELWNNRFDSI